MWMVVTVYCLENDDRNEIHIFRTSSPTHTYDTFDLYFVKTKSVEWEVEVWRGGVKGTREGIQGEIA